MFLTLLDVEMM